MGRSEAGSIKTVSSFESSDVRSFFEDNYRPPRMSVIASGNLDSEQVKDWASNSFDELVPIKAQRTRTPPIPHAIMKVFPRKDKQAYVGMGFPGVSSMDSTRFAQRLMTSVLGMGTSSRLFQEIRERQGLVYEIFAGSFSYTDCGAVGIFFNTSIKDQEKVIRTISSEIKKLKADGLQKDELDRAKRLLKGMYVRKLESTESRMVRLGEMFMSTGEAVPAEESIRRIDAVTEEEVINAAETTMLRNDLCIALHALNKESNECVKNLGDLEF